MLKPSQKILMLEPRFISAAPFGVRKSFDEYELIALRDSIEQNGIIVPLCVRETTGGRYTVISGERRLIAAKMAGLKKVPCFVKQVDDLTAAFLTMGENMQRSEPHFFEIAEALEKLTVNSELTAQEIAERLGVSGSIISNKLRLLRLSDILRERIISARLGEEYALLLLKLPPEKRETALNKIIADSLGVSESEKLVSEMLCVNESPKKPVKKVAVNNVKIFSNSLIKLIDTVKLAGFSADTTKTETEEFIQYTVRFSKVPEPPEYYQIPFC